MSGSTEGTSATPWRTDGQKLVAHEYDLDASLSQTEGAREARLRRRAKHLGFRVQKVRNWSNWIGNDGYIVVQSYNNTVIAGQRHALTLDQLEEWMSDELTPAELDEFMADLS